MSDRLWSRCVVCHEPGEPGAIGRSAIQLCEECGKSYDRLNRKDDTTAGLIVWAATRAWKFARRKKR